MHHWLPRRDRPTALLADLPSANRGYSPATRSAHRPVLTPSGAHGHLTAAVRTSPPGAINGDCGALTAQRGHRIGPSLPETTSFHARYLCRGRGLCDRRLSRILRPVPCAPKSVHKGQLCTVINGWLHVAYVTPDACSGRQAPGYVGPAEPMPSGHGCCPPGGS
jgi:hypothetical protein